MFSEPQEITINSIDKELNKVLQEPSKGVYASPDELFTLTVSHLRSNGRTRSMSRIDQKAIVPDVLTAVNDFETMGVYLVIDRPDHGFSVDQVTQLVTGLKTWLTSTNIGKLYGRES